MVDPLSVSGLSRYDVGKAYGGKGTALSFFFFFGGPVFHTMSYLDLP